MSENYFTELYSINVNDKTEKKGNLTYVSWSFAWAELKKRHPDATYTIYENADGFNYHHDGHTAWVKTGVTVNGIEHIEYLPIMDFKNKSIPVENVTSMDVNKAIQRSLTKAVARHGLGLYIYAGEDLPEDDRSPQQIKDEERFEKVGKEKISENDVKALTERCENDGLDFDKIYKAYHIKDFSELTIQQYSVINNKWEEFKEKAK